MSMVTTTMLHDSAFVLLRETTCCFFDDQLTIFKPKYMQKLVVDFRSSMFDPQSASAKARMDRSLEVVNHKPYERASDM